MHHAPYNPQSEEYKNSINEVMEKISLLSDQMDLSGLLEKLKNNYSSTNPPYIAQDAMQFLVDFGIEHFLIDMPSVDKEIDGGALASHHTFWNTKGNIRFNCTITELIFVPNNVFDGRYLLNLQFAPLENDASPSRPVLFEIQ